MREQHVLSTESLREVIERVTFAPSCVDMNWQWEIVDVDISGGAIGSFLGWNIRTTFRRPDRETGVPGTGYGRWWFIAHDTTVSGVVKTCFAAAKMIVEHELMEAFLYNGTRIFDPHNSVDAMAAIAKERR